MRVIHLIVAAVLGAGAAACGDEPKPKTASDVPKKSPDAKQSDKKDVETPTSGSIHIDDKISAACGDLPTAHFAFDSAGVTGEAATALDALARCFITGALKGKGMKLVGHADPRGTTTYNYGLGQKRAGSVSEFLANKGVESRRVATSSRGELEASGTDEHGWAQDRKVEILLAE